MSWVGEGVVVFIVYCFFHYGIHKVKAATRIMRILKHVFFISLKSTTLLVIFITFAPPPKFTENMKMDTLSMLLMSSILRYMPRARHHSLACSAGSLGYHALKEMLLSGVPGNTLLIESGDLREECPNCCLLYVGYASYDYHKQIPDQTTYVTVYSNMTRLPSCWPNAMGWRLWTSACYPSLMT